MTTLLSPRSDNAGGVFGASGRAVGDDWVVDVSGELDLASRDSVHALCLMGGARRVVVDLAELTFMDCAGYAVLVRAHRILTERGAALVLHHACGGPARLLQLVGDDGPVLEQVGFRCSPSPTPKTCTSRENDPARLSTPRASPSCR